MHDDWLGLRSAGKWIWHGKPRAGRSDLGFFHGLLRVPRGAVTTRLFVCADNRYVLYADSGRGPARLGRGPARGDMMHTALDPYELPLRGLRALRLWAQVYYVGGRPEQMLAEVHGDHPGLLVLAGFYDRRGVLLGRAGTGCAWRAFASRAIAPLTTPEGISGLGATERHRADDWPADWLRARPSSKGWAPAVELSTPQPKGFPPFASDDHWLVPRVLPQMAETPRAFVRMAPAGAPERAAAPRFPLHIPPRGRLDLLFDAGGMVCAYPQISLRGRGAHATVAYAEVLTRAAPGGVQKSHRLAAGFELKGPHDRLDMGACAKTHLFEPIHWHSFRFLRVGIEAGPEGALLRAVGMRVTGYPWKLRQKIAAPGAHAAAVRKLMEVSWRTIRCCTWETFMDCPFYEQLQYIGDTRIQMLVTHMATGDEALARQALTAFDNSRVCEGLTQSRGPTTEMQIIPTFSLIYILTLEDFLVNTGDRDFVAPLLDGVADILRWTARYRDPRTGLLGTLPYWPFVDWVHEVWDQGVPPGPPSSLINLFHLLALDAAARLCAGTPQGRSWRAEADALRRRIRRLFWDPRLRLLRDVPAAADRRNREFSQHAQALGVLAGVMRGADARAALRGAIEGMPGLELRQATLYFRFYLAEAVARAGWGAGLWRLLEPFREALAAGSTTWPETYEPCRSECHAWGSWPMYFFGRYVLGVNPPDARGRILVKPLRCPPLDRVEGTVMTRLGPVQVKVGWQGRRPALRVRLPPRARR